MLRILFVISSTLGGCAQFVGQSVDPPDVMLEMNVPQSECEFDYVRFAEIDWCINIDY